jgi:hypothetical protein
MLIISLNQINGILFVIDMKCGLCQVGIETLYITNINLTFQGV